MGIPQLVNNPVRKCVHWRTLEAFFENVNYAHCGDENGAEGNIGLEKGIVSNGDERERYRDCSVWIMNKISVIIVSLRVSEIDGTNEAIIDRWWLIIVPGFLIIYKKLKNQTYLHRSMPKENM